MRIAMLSRSLPFHQSGGMEEVCWDFAQSFAALGHQVLLVTTKGIPPDPLPKGLQVLCLEAPSGRYSLAWWRRTRQLYLERLHHEADVILGVGGGARVLGLRQRSQGPLWVTQAHGTAWGDMRSKLRLHHPWAYLKACRNLLTMLEDLTYRRCDAMIAVGQTVAKDLGAPPSQWLKGDCPVHLIPNGVNPQAFAFCPKAREDLRRKMHLKWDAKLVLMASRLHPQKGLREGIRGFERAALDRPDLHLAIAGKGPWAKALADRVATSPIKDRIHLVGHIPRLQLKNIFSASDMFLMPNLSQESGLPLTLLEAMAAGLPIAASRALADLSPEVIGLNPRDPESIAEAICLALKTCDHGRASRLPQTFTLHHAAQNYVTLFQTLLEQKSQA